MDMDSHEDEIPMPISSAFDHENPNPFHHPNGPLPLSTASSEEPHHLHHHHHQSIITYNSKKAGMVVKYRECLKNHAASIGGNAIDGCGEFMPSGEEGSLEALKCSACHCHRNFHRKEVEGEATSSSYCDFHGYLKESKVMGHKGLLIAGSHHPNAYNLVASGPSPHQMIFPLAAAAAAAATQNSESDHEMSRPPPLMVKKRFRTKFTQEQKEKMLGFAEKVGWRLPRQEESEVQQFCQEIGVKRRVLKVWMHNNKHNMAKKIPLQLE